MAKKATKEKTTASAKKSATKKKPVAKAAAKVPANAMDYPEHDRTYDAFLKVTIWGTAGCIALLIAMAFGFFAGGGLIGGTLLFIILMAACYFVI